MFNEAIEPVGVENVANGNLFILIHLNLAVYTITLMRIKNIINGNVSTLKRLDWGCEGREAEGEMLKFIDDPPSLFQSLVDKYSGSLFIKYVHNLFFKTFSH